MLIKNTHFIVTILNCLVGGKIYGRDGVVVERQHKTAQVDDGRLLGNDESAGSVQMEC